MPEDTNCNFPDNSDNDTKHLKKILMTYKMPNSSKNPHELHQIQRL